MDFQESQSLIKDKWLKLIGEFPKHKPFFEPEVISEEKFEHYTRNKIVLKADDFKSIRAFKILFRYKILQDLKRKITFLQFEQKNKNHDLNKFITQDVNVSIIADDREKGAGIIKDLSTMGAKVSMKRLEVGDYMLSSRCVVEFKTIVDFVDSIIDGRLLEQIRQLKKNYDRPLLVLQGVEDIYSQRNVHPNAIRGMIANITVSYGIPVIQTKNPHETASLLAIIAKREQEGKGIEFDSHFEKKSIVLSQQQEYLIASLPGIGSATAKSLLERFGTVKNIVNAKPEELQQIDKIG